jgi:probable rRNA maturation factor
VCLGEVVISVPTALRQAAPNGHDAITEILMLALHGTLHLLGYTDETEAEQQVMNQRACALLRAFGYPAKEVWYSRYDEN